MQTAIIAGNVGKDAVLRRTNNGDTVLGFSVAVSNGKDKPATWWDCSLWGKRAEALEQHITKGLKLTLSGRPSAREHDGKAYLQLSVQELTFMGGGNRDNNQRNDDQGGYGGFGGGRNDDQGGYTSNGTGGFGGGRDLDDDLPF